MKLDSAYSHPVVSDTKFFPFVSFVDFIFNRSYRDPFIYQHNEVLYSPDSALRNLSRFSTKYDRDFLFIP